MKKRRGRRNTNSSDHAVKMTDGTINANISGHVVKIIDGNILKITQVVD